MWLAYALPIRVWQRDALLSLATRRHRHFAIFFGVFGGYWLRIVLDYRGDSLTHIILQPLQKIALFNHVFPSGRNSLVQIALRLGVVTGFQFHSERAATVGN